MKFSNVSSFDPPSNYRAITKRANEHSRNFLVACITRSAANSIEETEIEKRTGTGSLKDRKRVNTESIKS